MVFRMAKEPSFHGRRLVRAVVVHDQVDLDPRLLGDIRIDLAQELEELLMSMATVTTPDHFASGHVQSREQRGGTVPDVVMSPSFGLRWLHRQQGLSAVQRLDLALLVDA